MKRSMRCAERLRSVRTLHCSRWRDDGILNHSTRTARSDVVAAGRTIDMPYARSLATGERISPDHAKANQDRTAIEPSLTSDSISHTRSSVYLTMRTHSAVHGIPLSADYTLAPLPTCDSSGFTAQP